MLNHVKSVVYGLYLFPRLVNCESVGKLASVGAVFRTLILWCWKFRELPQSKKQLSLSCWQSLNC
ncbi:hypothetical protein [Vibrio navarrensis]|uniref:hypothetical protein n=1 Tax=Vibrio navarrensis TaxID=29495 RepID=UPI002095DD3F|nr:hypothetical protein [Vibrio navarrensis]